MDARRLGTATFQIVSLLLPLVLFSVTRPISATEKVYIIKTIRDGLLEAAESNGLKTAASRNLWKSNQRVYHNNIISTVAPSNNKVYEYLYTLNGFAIKLNASGVSSLKENPDVEFVLESKAYKTTTTYTPRFLGLEGDSGSVWNITSGRDVIIGVVDTGVWPESASFDDTGFTSPPSKFKGVCEKGEDDHPIQCNKKLIGARYFVRGYEADTGISRFNTRDFVSPRDSSGHGTHTASTSGGSKVYRASINGANFGTMSGIAYNARIVAYKVCWGLGNANNCYDSDIISAFEAGVSDGVDLFTMSLGGSPERYYFDGLSMALLDIVRGGIPVVAAGGNSGFRTVVNSAPWMMTVGASYIDRQYSNLITLSNNQTFKGNAYTRETTTKQLFNLVDAASVGANGSQYSEYCLADSLNKLKVLGKIVLCKDGMASRTAKGLNVKNAGGYGMILYNQNPYTSLFTEYHSIPTSHIGYYDGLTIKEFIKNTKFPRAQISNLILSYGPSYGVAPQVAYFSSTGPNFASNHILKPDIIAPGVNIFASVSEFGSSKKFDFLSGTSMATPHVAGIIALIRVIYPSWKPSRIYSAIITTGITLNNKMGQIQIDNYGRATPWDMGSGMINPSRVLDPGLVYDVSSDQYLKFKCTPSGGFYMNTNWCGNVALREIDFNFPYLSIPQLRETTVVRRNLTLVGPPAIYTVSVIPPAGATLSVTPKTLDFTRSEQVLFYDITVTPVQPYTEVTVDYNLRARFTYGSITWSDNKRSSKINVAVNINP